MTAQRRQTKATPAVTTVAPAKAGGRFAFVGETIAEFKKVTWPSRRETVRLTSIVVAITVALGIILGAIDLGFARLVEIIGGSG